MSRKRKYKYDYTYGNTSPNFYMLLIVVLIVLQWFRVDSHAVSGVAPVALPESNLVANGGLFIITLFFLIACSCETSPRYYRAQGQHR
jgi:hypothetical membrane protein